MAGNEDIFNDIKIHSDADGASAEGIYASLIKRLETLEKQYQLRVISSFDGETYFDTENNVLVVKDGTITGGIIQTAVSGARVLMSGPYNELQIFDSNDVLRTALSSSQGLLFYDGDGDDSGRIYGWKNGGISLLVGDVDYFSLTGDFDCYDASVLGNLDVSGSKSFNIPHPTKEGKRLVYSCVESPEVLVMCRGKKGDKIPKHFYDVSEPDTLDIITGIDGNWLATAVRKGYLGKDCEPDAIEEKSIVRRTKKN